MDLSKNMLLENLDINPDDLPQMEAVDFESLESDYLYMRLTAWGLFFLMAAGVLTVLLFTTDVAAWMYYTPWAALFALVFIFEIIGFKIKGYAIRQKDVSYKSGLIWFHMTSVPFNRIQHCEISQGPLGRLFNLASVKVYTAGGSGSDLSISGLTKERAQRLRDFITKLSAEYE
ncbi:PH domain-containing protein [Owenweeksia hongkongensis]|uniref:PH domain-containing protein n=1 Tax=Owenweeksia hongkongensis TaxID=253245 RepID=UPI003A8F4E5F